MSYSTLNYLCQQFGPKGKAFYRYNTDSGR